MTYKVGDKVMFGKRHKATVIKVGYPIKINYGSPGALIEFDDKTKIPRQMEAPYYTLSHISTPTTTPPTLPVGNNQPTTPIPTPIPASTNYSPYQPYDIGQDPWCQGAVPTQDKEEKTCTHHYEVVKGFCFDHLVCSKCKHEKRYNPMGD